MTKWNYPEAVRTLQFSNIEFFRTFRNPKSSKTSSMWFKWETIRKISAFTQSNVIIYRQNRPSFEHVCSWKR